MSARDDGLTQTVLLCEHLTNGHARRQGFTLIPQSDDGRDAQERGGVEVYAYVCPACGPLLAGLGRVEVVGLPSSGG